MPASLAPKFPGKAGEELFTALGATLRNEKLDAAFRAMALSLPTEGELGLTLNAEGKKIDPDAVYAARHKTRLAIAKTLRDGLTKAHAKLANLSGTATDGVSMGKRSLKNLCLHYLALNGDGKTLAQVFKQVSAKKHDRSNRCAEHVG